MTTKTEQIWPEIVKTIGFEDDIDLLAMHLSEIETEAENVLELLTTLRSAAYHADRDDAQDTASELTIALEHLQGHLKALVPSLQKQLEIEP